MANRKIIWSKSALKQFEAAINYIAEDSIQNAEKVRKEILEKIERLIAHPEIYSPMLARVCSTAFVSWRTCAVVYSSLQSFVFIQERSGIQET